MAIKNTTKKPYIIDNDTNIKVGIDLPIRRGDGKDGYFASTSTTIEAVKNNIRNLLLTQRGERLMQPSLGLNLRKFLFEPIRQEDQVAIQEEIIETISFWLPFVVINKINVSSFDDNETYDKNTITVSIDFSIKQDPSTLNSVQVLLGGTTGEVSPVADGGY